jgi:hypothetical protein
VLVACVVHVKPDDLARVVNAISLRECTVRGIDGRVSPAVIKKAVIPAMSILVLSDDLAQIIDTQRKGESCGRVDQRGENAGTRVEDVTVRGPRSGVIKPSDLAGRVNALRSSTADPQWSVNVGV